MFKRIVHHKNARSCGAGMHHRIVEADSSQCPKTWILRDEVRYPQIHLLTHPCLRFESLVDLSQTEPSVLTGVLQICPTPPASG
jgi:hypothetical protein